jgi:hypothetical protein
MSDLYSVAFKGKDLGVVQVLHTTTVRARGLDFRNLKSLWTFHTSSD